MPPAARARLQTYVDRFNAHDFDGVRELLAEDARVEVVGRTLLEGRAAAGRYFGNYATLGDGWTGLPGIVEGRPAILIYGAGGPAGSPLYFILLEWEGERIRFVRDFLHAPYVVESAEYRKLA